MQEFTSDVKTIMAVVNDLDVNQEQDGGDEKPTCIFSNFSNILEYFKGIPCILQLSQNYGD